MKKEILEFLENIENEENQSRMRNVLEFVVKSFPELVLEYKWNQPMFTDHGTFIIGFSVAKKHIAVAPEAYTMQVFQHKLEELGYNYTKMFIRFPWNKPFDYVLLKELIQFNIADKADLQRFWRK